MALDFRLAESRYNLLNKCVEIPALPVPAHGRDDRDRGRDRDRERDRDRDRGRDDRDRDRDMRRGGYYGKYIKYLDKLAI